MTLPSPALTIASFVVAVVVGLTGMGGGALMTPMLVFFFGVPPLTAVGSDLVVSAVTKPFGAFVHVRRRTADLRLAAWLCAGSVPAAFSGVYLARLLGRGASLQEVVATATGVVLIIAAAAIAVKAYSDVWRRPAAQREVREGEPARFSVRPIPTILIGILIGLGVGMTSVGSGSLVIVALTAAYPLMPVRRLVGTDLVQAVPMVFAAAAAHLIAGDVQMSVTTALLVGGIPGVIIGSLLSSRAPSGMLRPVLAVVLLASGLKLLNVPLALIAWMLAVAAVGAAVFVLAARRRVAALKPAQDAGAIGTQQREASGTRP
jgi:uncharacterized membrane protein YfcA